MILEQSLENKNKLLKYAHYTKSEVRLILTGKKYGNTTASEIIENINLLLLFLNIDLELAHKNIARYKNEITKDGDVIWQSKKYKNSKPKKVLNFVQNFNSLNQNIMLFIRNKSSFPKYIYYGNVEKIEKIKKWEKQNDSFVFKFKIKQINKEENYLKSDDFAIENLNNMLSSVTGARSFHNLLYIGKKGEERFYNELAREDGQIYNQLIKLKIIKKNSHKSSNSISWLNQIEESYEPYDFFINNKKIDVKTSTINLNKFYISKNEHDLFLKGDLIIVQVLLCPKTYFYKDHRIILPEAKNDFEYLPLNYYAVPKNNFKIKKNI